MDYKYIDKTTGRDTEYADSIIVDFLHTHLEQYGDEKPQIQACLNYLHEKGGFILLGLIENEIAGAVVINETGMGGYIPENILVYIAMNNKFRGQGLGKKLMTEAINRCKGDIALHVEKDNPAKFLYEKLGFTNPYLEMRLKRN